ncbi:MAG: hypothetical protein ACRCY3_03245 [Sphingorhabdus sp.]
MGFLNTIWGMISAGAVLAFVLCFPLYRRNGELLVFLIVPGLAAIYAQIRLINLPPEMLGSTSALDVPFAAIWAGCGSLIGFSLAWLVNKQLR